MCTSGKTKSNISNNACMNLYTATYMVVHISQMYY